MMPPYTFKLLSDGGDRITSSLTLTAFDGFNGTVIRCIDTNLDTDEEQTTVAMVLGESNIIIGAGEKDIILAIRTWSRAMNLIGPKD